MGWMGSNEGGGGNLVLRIKGLVIHSSAVPLSILHGFRRGTTIIFDIFVLCPRDTVVFVPAQPDVPAIAPLCTASGISGHRTRLPNLSAVSLLHAFLALVQA